MAIWVSAATPGQPLLAPFLLSIAAGVVVASVIAAIGVTIYVLTGRRRVKSFFGIGEHNRIVVYVSRLRIDPFGSKDLEGVPRSYRGPGAAGNEFQLASEIQRFFVRLSPRFLRNGRASSIVRWVDIEVEALISPQSPFELEMTDGIVCLGSGAYNAASRAVEAHDKSWARLHGIGNEIEIGFAGAVEGTFTGGVCFVQRVRNSNGQIRIEAAGLSNEGTDAATRYLLSHFQELERGYRKGVPFCILLKVTESGVSVLRRMPSPSRTY